MQSKLNFILWWEINLKSAHFWSYFVYLMILLFLMCHYLTLFWWPFYFPFLGKSKLHGSQCLPLWRLEAIYNDILYIVNPRYNRCIMLQWIYWDVLNCNTSSMVFQSSSHCRELSKQTIKICYYGFANHFLGIIFLKNLS